MSEAPNWVQVASVVFCIMLAGMLLAEFWHANEKPEPEDED